MKMVRGVMTAEEREALILAARCLTNAEIAESLGVSVTKVKALLHHACVKMGGHTRIAATYFAILRGDISIDEFLTPDKAAEHLHGLSADVLNKTAQAVRLGAEREILRMIDEGVLHIAKEPHNILTKGERNILRFVGHGLTNNEIATRLFISSSRVRNVLNRACCKLGARSRADAFVLALQQGEIEISEVFSLDEILRTLARLKPESLEKISRALGEKPPQSHLRTAG